MTTMPVLGTNPICAPKKSVRVSRIKVPWVAAITCASGNWSTSVETQ